MAISFINERLWQLLKVKNVPEVCYKIHVHDETLRTIKTFKFYSMMEAMDLVNGLNLMYNTEKKVFLEHVKGVENSMIELNIYKKNVYKKRPSVSRSKKKHKVVSV